MIRRILFKIAVRLNLLTEKLKIKINPDNRAVTESEKSDLAINKSGFYEYNLFGKIIVTPFRDCFTSLINPIFKREIYSFVASDLQPLIIDCGANIGMGIIYWKNLYPMSRIIAFEPSKKVHEALLKNISAFNLADVKVINAALSDSEGDQAFTVNEGLSGSLNLEKDLGVTYSVKTVKLESYLTQKVDFLKVDIEGGEINIFPQILKHLDNIQNLFIEYHAFTQHRQQLSVFLNALEKNGFRYYIEGEYAHKAPLSEEHIHLGQDLQVGIWAKREKK